VFFGFERNFHLFLHPNLSSLLIAVPLAAIVYYFFSARLTRRLKSMNRTALKFAKGDFRERLEVRSNDEIGQLGRSLNYMADELASLEDMRRAFLANVFHDMRSPITSIKGFVSAILDGTIPPEREKHYLKMVKDSADRMLKLVEDLLDIARIEAGQFTIERVRFNLTERIRQTAARMEPLFKQYQIGIHMDDSGEDVYVRADPDRIEQVMTNLLQNAVYHSPPGSEVRFSVTRTPGAVTVSVADSGGGMTEEELSRMWDRFYKGDKARSKKNGTGIGLSIVKHILDLHGGEVQAESSPGQGTTVRFTLTDL
jgi:signal transduction histidine kinase